MAANTKLPKMAVGQRYGRLIVLERAENDRWHRTTWKVRCDCGNETIASANFLRTGTTKSCGCWRSEYARIVGRRTSTKHGMVESREYQSWVAMRTRCYNSNAHAYDRYGGRGITVCERWRESFDNFFADMGARPPATSLDRINNDGNYEPGNCRWATHGEQRRNRRDCVKASL
jgi:hypothetical protein